MNDNKETVVNVEDLIQDDKNFNKGTDEGKKLIEKSFSELGAGRSILIDKNNRIIAGNKSSEAAIATGIKKVRVIETTGDELIAVKRTDVDLDSERGRKLALADNSTAAANLSWDEMQIAAVADEYGFDTASWGISDGSLDPIFDEVDVDELIDVASKKEAIQDFSPDTNYDLKRLYRSKVNPSILKEIKKGIKDGQICPEIADVLTTRAAQCTIFNFDEIIKYYRSNDATDIEKKLLLRLYLVFISPLELVEKGILKINKTAKRLYDEELLQKGKQIEKAYERDKDIDNECGKV